DDLHPGADRLDRAVADAVALAGCDDEAEPAGVVAADDVEAVERAVLAAGAVRAGGPEPDARRAVGAAVGVAAELANPDVLEGAALAAHVDAGALGDRGGLAEPLDEHVLDHVVAVAVRVVLEVDAVRADIADPDVADD